MTKALITTIPFAEKNRLPLEILGNAGIQYLINPLNRRLTESDLINMISDFDIIIAGTEPITEKVMENAEKLKLISRVGIGIDNVDLNAAKKRGIKVCYTPDAPAPAVAELTLCLMLNLLRFVHISNTQMHIGEWYRHHGRRLPEVTIGIIGLGRIGTRVLRRIRGFGTPRILANDIMPNLELNREFKLEWSTKEKIFQEADLISLHLPLTPHTNQMIGKELLYTMKKDAVIINTSRGGIIIEKDLVEVMKSGHLSGAAIDVFENEPYDGPLKDIERCILTSHLGSMSIDCRNRMEIEATEEAVLLSNGKRLNSEVPDDCYLIQKQTK